MFQKTIFVVSLVVVVLLSANSECYSQESLSNEELTKLVKAIRGQKGFSAANEDPNKFAIYALPTPVKGKVKVGGVLASITTTFETNVLVFVDHHPGANWEHKADIYCIDLGELQSPFTPVF